MANALTLPGSIPGILRTCSPVVYHGRKAIILYGPWMDGDVPRVEIGGLDLGKPIPVWTADVSLDLTDPTGRAHAAWWVQASDWPVVTPIERSALLAAQRGEAMTADELPILHRLMLRLAGVIP